MDSESEESNSCVWCDVATTLEEKISGLKPILGKTCILCIAAAIAALTLLTVIWTMTIVIN